MLEMEKLLVSRELNARVDDPVTRRTTRRTRETTADGAVFVGPTNRWPPRPAGRTIDERSRDPAMPHAWVASTTTPRR